MRRFLPELFCCRSIGDGFGLIINAIQSGLANSAGEPTTKAEVIAIRQALRLLRDEPFIPTEAATDILMRLEDAGLSIEPSGFDALADLLNG